MCESLSASPPTINLIAGKEGKVVIARTDAETAALIEGRGLERTWRQILNYPRN